MVHWLKLFNINDVIVTYPCNLGKHINFITGSAEHDGAGFIILNPVGIPLLGDSNNRVQDNDTMWESARG